MTIRHWSTLETACGHTCLRRAPLLTEPEGVAASSGRLVIMSSDIMFVTRSSDFLCGVCGSFLCSLRWCAACVSLYARGYFRALDASERGFADQERMVRIRATDLRDAFTYFSASRAAERCVATCQRAATSSPGTCMA
jgi:hypothetical protein